MFIKSKSDLICVVFFESTILHHHLTEHKWTDFCEDQIDWDLSSNSELLMIEAIGIFEGCGACWDMEPHGSRALHNPQDGKEPAEIQGSLQGHP